MKIILATLLVMFCLGCSKDSVEIDQDIELDSYVECTYKIRTYVRVNGTHFEYGNVEFDVPKDSVAVVKTREYNKAYPYFLKVQKCIDDGCNDCE